MKMHFHSYNSLTLSLKEKPTTSKEAMTFKERRDIFCKQTEKKETGFFAQHPRSTSVSDANLREKYIRHTYNTSS